jgi:hypothetical protein
MTLHDFSIDYAPAIQAVAAVLGLVSLVLVWYQIRKTNDWNRNSAAFAIMELERFYTLEEQATKFCKVIEVPFPAPLNIENASKVRSNYDAYHAVKNLVIFLDRICVAYQAGYVDKEVLAFTYGPIIIGYYGVLSNYIFIVRQEMGAPEAYRDFARTANDVTLIIEKCRHQLKSREGKRGSHGGIMRKF